MIGALNERGIYGYNNLIIHTEGISLALIIIIDFVVFSIQRAYIKQFQNFIEFYLLIIQLFIYTEFEEFQDFLRL
jgi:uncharacterized ion transporter superfamily protein YfcC